MLSYLFGVRTNKTYDLHGSKAFLYKTDKFLCAICCYMFVVKCKAKMQIFGDIWVKYNSLLCIRIAFDLPDVTASVPQNNLTQEMTTN